MFSYLTMTKEAITLNEIMNVSVGSFTLLDLIKVVAVAIVAFILTKVILRFCDRTMKNVVSYKSLKSFVRFAVKLILLIIALIIILDILGIPVTSLIALLSVAGLSISLALQTTLQNLAGGILLIISKPFAVGDYVSIGGVEGTATSIGLAYTTLNSPENKVIYLPNSQMSSEKIQNFTRIGTRRIDFNVDVPYRYSVEDVKRSLYKAASKTEKALSDPAAFCNVCAYKDSNIGYLVRIWSLAGDYWDAYFGLIENIKKAFDEDGISFEYSHLNVHIVENKQ